MTTFEYREHDDIWRMSTLMPHEIRDRLVGVQEMGTLNLTRVVNQVVAIDQAIAELPYGSALLTLIDGKLEPLHTEPPTPTGAEEIEVIELNVNLTPGAHDHIAGLTDPEEPSDLLTFWGQAVSQYEQIVAADLTGGKLVVVQPDLSAYRLELVNGPFSTQEARTEPKRRFGWLRRLMDEQ